MPKTTKLKKKKDSHLHIRARRDQIAKWRKAAEQAERSLSSWATLTLDSASR